MKFFAFLEVFVIVGGFVGIVIVVMVFSEFSFRPDTRKHETASYPDSSFLSRRQKIPSNLYSAYAMGYHKEQYGINDRDGAVAILLTLVADPDVKSDAKILSAYILEGIDDSEMGRPMRYETGY